MVNQMAADAQRFLFLMPAIQNFFLVPLYVAYALTYLALLLGPASLPGLVVMALCMVATQRAGARLKREQVRQSVGGSCERRVWGVGVKLSE